MDNLNNFVNLLCPFQRKFNPKCDFFPKTVTLETPLIKIMNEPAERIMSNWGNHYQLPSECVEKLEVIENSRIYNLYTSILYLLSSKYNTFYTFDQKTEFIEEFIRLLISKMETDIAVKKCLRETPIKINVLIDEIKNKQYQSANVVFYVSVILDINIIVLPQCGDRSHIELYSSDIIFDTCKPCIILSRSGQDIYCPVHYNKESVLIYYDHDIIPILVKHDKTLMVNFSTYTKIKNK